MDSKNPASGTFTYGGKASEEKVHLYFRDVKGKIITHFLMAKRDWDVLENDAKESNTPISEYISSVITKAIKSDAN